MADGGSGAVVEVERRGESRGGGQGKHLCGAIQRHAACAAEIARRGEAIGRAVSDDAPQILDSVALIAGALRLQPGEYAERASEEVRVAGEEGGGVAGRPADIFGCLHTREESAAVEDGEGVRR